MNDFRVTITDKAMADMAAIYEYIAAELHAPDNAMRQYDRIANEIEALNLFPYRNKLFDSQPEHDLGFRRLLVDNYSVIYIVEDDTVTVIRVLYSSSDIIARLRDGI